MKSGAPFTPKTSGRSIALLPLPQMDCASRYATAPGEVLPTIGFWASICRRVDAG
jgi:hypothetical protein